MLAGEWKTAEAAFSRAVEADPGNALALFSRAVANAMTKPDRVLGCKFDGDQREAKKLDPDCEAAFRDRVGPRAEAILAEFHTIHDAFVASCANVLDARAKIAEGKFPEAFAALDEAERAYRTGIIHLIRGFLCSKVGDFRSAASNLSKALEIAGKQPVELMALGRACLGGGDLPHAVKAFDILISNLPHDGDWKQNLRNVERTVIEQTGIRPSVLEFRKIGEVDQEYGLEVTEDFNLLISGMAKNLPEIHFLRGLAHRAGGDREAARADFQRALDLGPELPVFLIARATALAHAGEEDRAEADFVAALAKNPNAESVFLGYTGPTGQADLDALRRAVRKARLRNPGPHPEAWLDRGVAHFEEGRYAPAISDLTEALRLRPDLADAWLYRGRARPERGEYRKAITDLTAALRLMPDSVPAYRARAKAYDLRGDRDLAAADRLMARRLAGQDD